MASHPRALCPDCGFPFAVRGDGRLMRHKSGSRPCSGSESVVPDYADRAGAPAEQPRTARLRADLDLALAEAARLRPAAEAYGRVAALLEEHLDAGGAPHDFVAAVQELVAEHGPVTA